VDVFAIRRVEDFGRRAQSLIISDPLGFPRKSMQFLDFDLHSSHRSCPSLLPLVIRSTWADLVPSVHLNYDIGLKRTQPDLPV
jgi:hypothetical protein